MQSSSFDKKLILKTEYADKIAPSCIKHESRLINFLLYFLVLNMICAYTIMLHYAYLDFIFTAFRFILCLVVVGFNWKFIPVKTRRLFLAFSFFILISYLTHLSGLVYAMNTFCVLIILMVLCVVKVNARTWKRVIVLTLLYIAVFLFLAPDLDHYRAAGVLIIANPNSCAFLSFIAFFLSTLFLRNKRYRFLFLVISAYFFLFQFKFGSRTMLMLCLAVIFFKIIFHFKKTVNHNNLKALMFVLMSGSVIFAYLYAITLFDLWGHGKIIIFGKDIFTGRQTIWAQAFHELSGYKLLFGIGNTLEIRNGVNANLHNQMMGYLVVYGLPVFVLFIFLFIRSSIDVLKRLRNINFLIFTLAVLLSCYFETLLYSNTSIAVCLAYILIVNFTNGRQNAKK